VCVFIAVKLYISMCFHISKVVHVYYITDIKFGIFYYS